MDDEFLTSIGIDPGTTSSWSNASSPTNNDIMWDTGYYDDPGAYSNEGRNYTTPGSTQGSGGSPINASTSSSWISDLGNKLKGLGVSDYAKVASAIGGLYAASQPNSRTAAVGYQGGIPKYTAVRMPGANGKLGGNVVYTRAGETPVIPAGLAAAYNKTYTPEFKKALEDAGIKTAAAGGSMETGGFVIPADVVSHLGNGSSDAGLKLLTSELGAEPIRGEGDGMSDSIPTSIDGKQKALVAHEEAYISPEKVAEIGGGDARKGAQRLRDMMDRIRKARTGSEEQGKQINPNKFMPGGEVTRYATGGSTGTTGSTSVPAGATGVTQGLSGWAGDYVTDLIGRGSALAAMPYEQYSGDLYAKPTDLQTKAFAGIQNLPTYSPGGGGYSPISATTISSNYQAPEAYQAGTFNANDYYTAPDPFQVGTFNAEKFSTEAAQQYMNPYLEKALAPQLEEARRQAQISRLADAARLTKAGAYGGSRQAIMESEGQRNLGTLLSKITNEGYATAYDKAAAQFNADQARILDAAKATEQSRQFGYGQMADVAKTRGLYGLEAAKAGEQSRQFGYGQLADVAKTRGQLELEAAKGNQSAATTVAQANLNAQMQAAQIAEQSRQFAANQQLQGLRAMAELGNIQRGIEADRIAAEKAQFEEARANPYKMIQFEQSLLSGLPLAAQTYNLMPTSNLQQFASGVTTVDQLLKTLGIKKS